MNAHQSSPEDADLPALKSLSQCRELLFEASEKLSHKAGIESDPKFRRRYANLQIAIMELEVRASNLRDDIQTKLKS